MQSKVILTKSLSEIHNQIKTTIDHEFQPTLAIVFASIECDYEQLMTLFNTYNIELIGSSTAGEIGNIEIQKGGISVLLLDINPQYFKVIQEEANYANSFEVGEIIAKKAKNYFANPAFIMVFSMNINGVKLVEGISNVIQSFPSIFGGMAGDDMQMKNSYTFSNNQISNNLSTILVIDHDKVAVEGMALCGWEPIGLENTITKAAENIIYEINNEPALNVVKRYFGDYFDNSMEETSVPLGAAQYPLQILRKDRYVLRAALDADEASGSLLMAGPVDEGDSFRFSVAPGFQVIDETVDGFKKYAQNQSEADAVLMFSCVARHMSLGPLIEDEIEGIYNIWKKPMVGLFCYGEVGQQGTGTSYFYNETCSLVLLKER